MSWGVMFGSRITLCFDSPAEFPFQTQRFNGPTSRRVMDMVEEDITNLWDLAPAKMEIDASKGMEWVMSVDELNIQDALYLFSNQNVRTINNNLYRGFIAASYFQKHVSQRLHCNMHPTISRCLRFSASQLQSTATFQPSSYPRFRALRAKAAVSAAKFGSNCTTNPNFGGRVNRSQVFPVKNWVPKPFGGVTKPMTNIV